MSWKVTKNSELSCIEMAYCGETSGKDLRDCTSETIRLAKIARFNKILSDLTEMVLTAKLSEIHDVSDKQFFEESVDPQGRQAMYYRESQAEEEMIEYFASVARNRGWKVEIFTDRETAVKWLQSAKF